MAGKWVGFCGVRDEGNRAIIELQSTPKQLFSVCVGVVVPSRVKIHAGRWPGPVRVLGPVEVRKDAISLHKYGPEIAEMISALQVLAATMGANAVIQTAYELVISQSGWHTFALGGTAVVTGITEEPQKPVGTDFTSQMNHYADLLDRNIITYEEYEERVAWLRHQHEKFDR